MPTAAIMLRDSAFKGIREWFELYGKLAALEEGESSMPTAAEMLRDSAFKGIREWFELYEKLAALELDGGGGGGSGAGSGYGIGGFGTVPWDTTPVPSGASTGLSNGVLVPHFATVGWGKTINDHFFLKLNDLMDRVTVLEEAIP